MAISVLLFSGRFAFGPIFMYESSQAFVKVMAKASTTRSAFELYILN